VGTGTTTGIGSTFSFGLLTVTVASGKTLSIGGIGNTGANSSDSVSINGVTFGAGNFSNAISNNLSLPGTLSLGNITGAGTTATVTMTLGGTGFTSVGDISDGTGGSKTTITYNGTGILQITGTGAATNFSGGLNLTGNGTIRTVGANSFGASTNAITLTGGSGSTGTLDIRTDSSLSIPNPITVNTNSITINLDQASSMSLGNIVTFGGATTVLGSTSKTLTLTSGSDYGFVFTNGFNDTRGRSPTMPPGLPVSAP
jgi:hypothetical protein